MQCGCVPPGRSYAREEPDQTSSQAWASIARTLALPPRLLFFFLFYFILFWGRSHCVAQAGFSFSIFLKFLSARVTVLPHDAHLDSSWISLLIALFSTKPWLYTTSYQQRELFYSLAFPLKLKQNLPASRTMVSTSIHFQVYCSTTKELMFKYVFEWVWWIKDVCCCYLLETPLPGWLRSNYAKMKG